MKTIYTVEQINKYIKNMFAQDFLLSSVTVKGEVSNCKYHSAGHIYFSLKDGDSVIKCVMFAGRGAGLKFRLEDGQQVVVSGNIDVYVGQGAYQLYANQITLDGAGALYEKFEALKRELEEEGMFSPTYKQPIPKNPKTIGVVTASTGAAIRDIINVSTRRNPYIQIVLYPALVQGADAAPSIVKGIKALEKYGVDVMIVGRGGGSIEDLWAFNERIVAQAIFDCSIPIISAVGHEVDFTIADFVADLRAATPSAAAELAVTKIDDILSMVDDRKNALDENIHRLINNKREKMIFAQKQLSLLSPSNKIRQSREKIARKSDALDNLVLRLLDSKNHKLAVLGSKLEGNSPLKKLESGFAYVALGNGKRVVSVNDVKSEDKLEISLKDGCIKADVTAVLSK